MIRELFRNALVQRRGDGLSADGRGPSHPWNRDRNIRLRACTLGLLFLLAGCGGPPATETPTVTPGSPPATAQAAVVTPAAAQPNDDGPSANATPAADLTLGELADRINAQWAGLTRFREESTFTAGPATGNPGSAVASPASQRSGRSVREVILPDRARYLAEENGAPVFELVVIGEQVFARGTVATLLDPTARPGEWIVTDLTTIASNPMLGATVASQFAVLAPPAYVVAERLRPQPVRDLGATEHDGTECALYGAADTTDTGTRIDFTVAIDPDDRLCFIETRSIGISSRYLVEEDRTIIIEPPASFRPAASPAGTPDEAGTPIRIPSLVATP